MSAAPSLQGLMRRVTSQVVERCRALGASSARLVSGSMEDMATTRQLVEVAEAELGMSAAPQHAALLLCATKAKTSGDGKRFPLILRPAAQPASLQQSLNCPLDFIPMPS